MLLNLLLTLLLVGLNGFFVAAEFAIVKVRSSQLELKAQAGNASAKLATNMVSNLDGYLAATQFGITLASLGLGWIGEPVVSQILIAGFELAGLSLRPELAHQIALPVAFALITVLHIVFGELAPKSLAIQRSETTTLLVAYPLQGFYVIFRPFIWLLNGVAGLVLKGFGIEASHGNEVHSPDELKFLVHQSQEEADTSNDNTQTDDLTIVEKAFDFSSRTVRQIMTPRTNIFGVDASKFNEDTLELILSENYSRILCYEDDLDHVLGIIHLRELLVWLRKNPSVDLHQLIRPALIVPETKRIRVLLRDFQQQRKHVAIVVNEYGGTEGLVTMEDILEELVGEIQDESDDERPMVEQVSDRTYAVLAGQSLDDMNPLLPHPVQKRGNYETLAGLLLDRFGRLPEVGEKTVIDEYEATILAKNGNSIERVELLDVSEED
ncbi:hemolysin family protein [Spirosoma sp. KUDC1026]|uniref:hemolysin family protein n=1 Tax=Spirosoma sp. KUDC1026 TaxID=2745947 RepID=UPI00159BA209|nr:hemolysin family protein [Spirosoma sp. KUDC1026]QKZ13474.1 HlyC/CorC family transporter [Spirosoma sp. KUDC1026]